LELFLFHDCMIRQESNNVKKVRFLPGTHESVTVTG
jgi:hypothetical protein